MIAVFQGVDGAVDKTGENFDKLKDQTETLNADPMVKMQKAVNDLKIALAPLLGVIANVVSAIATWVSNNPTLAATIAAIVTAIGILVGICMALAPIFVTLSGAAAVLGTTIGAVALPVLAVIAAIGLLIAAGIAIWKNWDTISQKTSEIWGAITEYLSGAWEGIKETAVNVWNSITDFFKEWGPTILVVLSGPIGWIATFIKSNWDAIKSTTSSIWNGITSFLSSVWNGIKGVASSVWNGIKSTISSVVNGMKTTISSVWNGIKSTTTTIWNGVKSAIVTPIEAAKDKISGIIDTIKGFFSKLKLKIPKIEMPKMPHFSLETGSKTIMGKTITYPKGFNVDWYDKGGVFYGPQVIGVGEKRPEFVGALDDLRAIVSASMREVMSGGGTTNNSSSSTVNFDGFMNGATFVVQKETDIQEIARELYKLAKKGARSQGVIM